MKNNCKCSLRISLVGEGCRYCQPQNYIDILEDALEEITAERDAMQAKLESVVTAQPDTSIIGMAKRIERGF